MTQKVRIALMIGFLAFPTICFGQFETMEIVIGPVRPPAKSRRIEGGWRGLLTFKSTRSDVLEELGPEIQGKWGGPSEREYVTDDAQIFARYSGIPCDPDEDVFYRHNVPADTLIDYRVLLRKGIPISQFTFDENWFWRYDSSKTGVKTSYFSFYQAEKEVWKVPNWWSGGWGIEFWGETLEGKDYIKGFRYGRPYDLPDATRCQ